MFTAAAPGRRSLCAVLFRISYVCSLSSCEDSATSASSDEATISAGSQEDDGLRRPQKLMKLPILWAKRTDHHAVFLPRPFRGYEPNLLYRRGVQCWKGRDREGLGRFEVKAVAQSLSGASSVGSAEPVCTENSDPDMLWCSPLGDAVRRMLNPNRTAARHEPPAAWRWDSANLAISRDVPAREPIRDRKSYISRRSISLESFCGTG